MANIDESNFRECAQEAIKKYRDGGKVIDALVWGTIVRLYNDRLEKMEALLQRWDALYPNVSELGRGDIVPTSVSVVGAARGFPAGACAGSPAVLLLDRPSRVTESVGKHRCAVCG